MLNSVVPGQALVPDVSFTDTSSDPAVFDYNGMAGGGGGGGEEDGGTINEWSSFIGITTAIAGNILISFALNIQRYAHIRIEREWAQRRSWWKKGMADRRKAPGRHSTSTYGTVMDGEEHEGDAGDEGEGHSGQGHGRGETSSDEDGGTIDTERLQQSLLSDQTISPFEKDPPTIERKSYLKSPYWWIGIILMTTGEAGNFLAYGFAPASIVSPLGVVALVSNCLIAPFMLKEKFRMRDFWGVLVAVGGAVTVVLSAKTSETKMGPGDIWKMITTWEFELYLGLTAALIVGLMWASGRYGNKTILIDLGLVGLFGGYTALSTKGVSSLLSYKLWHVITFGITYALVLVLVFSALMQIRYLNRALQRFDSTQVIPTQFVLFTLAVIIGSAVLYRDFESTTAAQAGKFVGGCALTFAGVYLITSGRASLPQESELDEEEALSLLQEEPLQERPQWGPDQDISRPKPDRISSVRKHHSRSPARSLLDEDIEDDDGSIRSPHLGLSRSPSTRLHSVSTSSLASPNQGIHSPSSPSAPHSLTENPWLASDEQQLGTTTSGLAQTSHAEQSPRTRDGYPPAPSVLLRFPSAPGHAESPSGGDAGGAPISPYQRTQTADEPSRGLTPRHTAPHTPPSISRKRHSISKRLAPKPLLAPLSSGLNAIVAESLRRRGSGEHPSPTRRNSSTLGRSKGKRRIYTDELEGDIADESAIEATPNRDNDDDHDIIRSKGQSTGRGRGNVAPTGSPSRRQSNMAGDNSYTHQGQSTLDPGTTQEDNSRTTGQGADRVRKHHRVRSFSDSWRDGIAWLSNTGGDERERKKRRKGDAADPDDEHDTEDERPRQQSADDG